MCIIAILIGYTSVVVSAACGMLLSVVSARKRLWLNSTVATALWALTGHVFSLGRAHASRNAFSGK
jgi:hypothetical protein